MPQTELTRPAPLNQHRYIISSKCTHIKLLYYKMHQAIAQRFVGGTGNLYQELWVNNNDRPTVGQPWYINNLYPAY